MKTTHKFELKTAGQIAEIKLPLGAIIQKVDHQYGRVFIWVFVNTSLPYDQSHEFLILGTGEECPEGFWPFGSFCELAGNGLVWHVYSRLSGSVRLGLPS